ncbi:hypothetical protein [Micromonospora arida]|uniref:hypothetical protein n=1 Tax=Micromonospora arida TaxID=2203715 RepID=UPI0033BAA0A4
MIAQDACLAQWASTGVGVEIDPLVQSMGYPSLLALESSPELVDDVLGVATTTAK